MSRTARCLLAVASVAMTLGCADGHDHHIPPEVEADAQLMTIPMSLGQAEYGPANWVKAVNYSTAWRGKGQITTIVVHTIQGSYKGAISWFLNPKSKVSSHYVLGKNGEVTQMVKEKDIAWHVGSANGYTIGLEHEGYVSDPKWVTPEMLDASAKLTCYLVKKYDLKATKTHIKGHVELPNQSHTDPGKYWPWASYLKKVQDCVGGKVEPPPKAGCCELKVKKSGSTVIDNTGNNCIQKFGSPNTWWNATDSGYGGSMNYTYTATSSYPDNWARWRLTFAKAGKYRVDTWVPAKHAGAPVTYKIKHDGVISKAKVDQKIHSNKWIKLGEWTFKGDCDEWVVLEDSQGVKGIQMGVDAIRLTPADQPPKCPASCSDMNACTTDSCSNGQCVHKNNSAACNDGNPCTKGDVCSNGKCKPGAGASCSDGNPCTKDFCTAKGGCSHSPTSGTCDDGNPCTSGDSCASGNCKGKAKVCDDGNPCTDDFCGAGSCTSKSNKMFCDDGDGCTSGDQCVSGKCTGKATACDDSSPCTVDSCKAGACSHIVAPGACDDGDACTSDKCGAGGCTHGQLSDASCDDNNACTKGDACDKGVCGAGPGNGCDDGDPCTLDRCDKGTCKHEPKPGCTGGSADAGGQVGPDGDASGDGAETTGDAAPDGGGLQGGDVAHAGDVRPGMMAAPASGCTAGPTDSDQGAGRLLPLWLLMGCLALYRTRRRPLLTEQLRG